MILTRVSLVYDLKKLYLNPASSFIISSGLGKLSQRFSESLVYVFQKRKLLFCTLPLLLSIKLPYVFEKRKVILQRLAPFIFSIMIGQRMGKARQRLPDPSDG